MARPSKSADVIVLEKKSHRTKAELEQRKAAESASLTGKYIKERDEIRQDAIAHKEFARICKLLKIVNKNDALYEAVINRYCLLYSECKEMAELKKQFADSKNELKTEYESGGIDTDELKPSVYYRLLTTMQNNILSLDKQISSKQKMMFDIEKEFAMTISSAMRSIPKNEEPEKDPLLEALKND